MSEYIPKTPFDLPKPEKPKKRKPRIDSIENLPLHEIAKKVAYHATLVIKQTGERIKHRELAPHIWRGTGYLCCPITGLLFCEDGHCVQSTRVVLDISTLKKGKHHGNRKTPCNEEACCKEGGTPAGNLSDREESSTEEIVHSCGLDAVVHDSLTAVVDL